MQIRISSVTVQNPPVLLPPRSVCPLPICPSCRCRSQPLSGVSRKQRYNTLDFPRESRVPTGMLLAPIGNPEPKGLRPLWTPRLFVQWLSILLRTLDTHLPEQAKQAQRFARVAGRFLCLFYLTNIARTCDVFLSVVTHSAIIRLIFSYPWRTRKWLFRTTDFGNC